MRALRLVAWAALALTLAASLARPSPAAACSWPEDSTTVADTPANGVVVISTYCAFGPCFDGALPTTELPVIDRVTELAVAGEIVRIDGDLSNEARILWRPSSPLIEGREYEVMWQPEARQAFALLDYVFVALPAAAEWTAQDVVLDPSLLLEVGSSESIQCTALWEDSCGGNTTSVSFGERPYVLLNVAIDFDASPQGIADLLVMSAEFWTSENETPVPQEVDWRYLNDAYFTFDNAATAYCYRVEVTSLVDDSVAVHEDCIEHGDLGAVETTPYSDAQIAMNLAVCLVPPERAGAEELWCEGRREACARAAAENIEQPGCATLEHDCEAFPVTPDAPDASIPTGGTGAIPSGDGDGDGDGDTGDGDGDSDTGNGDTDAMSPASGTTRTEGDDVVVTSGCAVHASHASNAWSALLPSLFALALLRRKRGA